MLQWDALVAREAAYEGGLPAACVEQRHPWIASLAPLAVVVCR